MPAGPVAGGCLARTGADAGPDSRHHASSRRHRRGAAVVWPNAADCSLVALLIQRACCATFSTPGCIRSGMPRRSTDLQRFPDRITDTLVQRTLATRGMPVCGCLARCSRRHGPCAVFGGSLWPGAGFSRTGGEPHAWRLQPRLPSAPSAESILPTRSVLADRRRCTHRRRFADHLWRRARARIVVALRGR